MQADAVSWNPKQNGPTATKDDDQWHVALAPGEVKVVSLEQLDDLFRLSIVDAETKVWQPGMNEWLPLRVIAGMDDDAEDEQHTPVIPASIAPSPAASAAGVRPAPPPPKPEFLPNELARGSTRPPGKPTPRTLPPSAQLNSDELTAPLLAPPLTRPPPPSIRPAAPASAAPSTRPPPPSIRPAPPATTLAATRPGSPSVPPLAPASVSPVTRPTRPSTPPSAPPASASPRTRPPPPSIRPAAPAAASASEPPAVVPSPTVSIESGVPVRPSAPPPVRPAPIVSVAPAHIPTRGAPFTAPPPVRLAPTNSAVGAANQSAALSTQAIAPAAAVTRPPPPVTAPVELRPTAPPARAVSDFPERPAPLAFSATRPASVAPVISAQPAALSVPAHALRPTPIAAGLGRSGTALIALAVLVGLSLTLYRNGIVLDAARALHRETAYQQLEAALGGPPFGTLRAIEMSQTTRSLSVNRE